jgi:hypothetical protein
LTRSTRVVPCKALGYMAGVDLVDLVDRVG